MIPTQRLSWDAERARALIEELRDLPGALLPMLHALQTEFGCVPREAVPLLAEVLNLSRAEVHGVISFYHDFRAEPPGRHVVRICRAESCQAMGAEALAAHAERRLGIPFGGTTLDRMFTLDPVFCLGHCACSPAVMIDDEPHARMTPARLDILLAATREKVS